MPTAESQLYFQQGSSVIGILISSGVPGNYQLAREQWTPNVTKRRKVLLSGQANYEPVLEEMTLNITGATAAICFSNLRALYTMLDGANRWYDNQMFQHTIIGYRPKGSDASVVYQAIVIGNATDEDILSLVPTFDDVGFIFRLNGVVIRFWRLGLWLGETDTATSGATAPGIIGTCTLAAGSGIVSPCDTSLRSFNLTTMPGTLPNLVLITADRDTDTAFTAINSQYRLQTILATNFAGGAFTSFAEPVANRAKGGNVLRYTPVATTFAQSTSFSIVTNFMQGKTLGIYATVRNNSATTAFRVKVGVQNFASAIAAIVTTQETLIDTSSLNPRVVFLGTVQTPSGFRANTFVLQVAASAVSGSLDIDELVIVNIDDETTSIIELATFSPGTELDPVSTDIRFDTHHNQAMPAFTYPILPTQAQAIANIGGTPPNFFAPNVTALLPVYSKTITKDWILIGPYSTYWIYPTNAGGVPTFTLRIDRKRAYMVPE